MSDEIFTFDHAPCKHNDTSTTPTQHRQQARRRCIEAALSFWRPRGLCFQHWRRPAAATATDAAAPQALRCSSSHRRVQPHPGLHASGHGQEQQVEWKAESGMPWRPEGPRCFVGTARHQRTSKRSHQLLASSNIPACRAHLRCGGVACGLCLSCACFISSLLTELCL